MSVSATKRISLFIVIVSLGIIIAPLLWFPFFTTKAYPGQHLINALAGVMLGPWWAAAAAILIGIVRNILGIGTIYAFPGGIPGGVVVGLVYLVTRRSKRPAIRYLAALAEPIGTVLIGGTLSLAVIAPIIGDPRLLGAVEQYGLWRFLPVFWSGWALSSIPGSVAGYLVLLALDRIGVMGRILGLQAAIQAKQKDHL
ncbi:MAG: energy coupling factor transporter S component ThiW [Thaumarchaeota archaeon]|nr:energy coupling factor transporter S component ThiW [Nitrososphaerota archaeon]MCL7386051.1 energy coupling factor transporter S component ThiW [Candidatus Wolframiiraptor allenii]